MRKNVKKNRQMNFRFILPIRRHTEYFIKIRKRLAHLLLWFAL